MLMSKLIDHLTDGSRNDGLAYFYCERNIFIRRQPTEIFRSFVRQLSAIDDGREYTLQAKIVQVYDERHSRGFQSGDLTLMECKELLAELFAPYTNIVLLLDALDECDEISRREIIGIFEHLTSSSPKVKVVISSRRNDDIKFRLEKQDKVNIGISVTDNEADIG